MAAELAGVHPQTLRIYERKGLVDPARTGGGSRRYSERDIEQLRRIQDLTNDGLNLARREAVSEPGSGTGSEQGSRPPGARHDAVEGAHRQYRRDLVPLKQSLVRFEGRR